MSSAEACPVSRLERLLLATDRSVHSEGAVREAINFAKKCSSKLYVLSVLESNPEYETIGANIFRKEEEEALKYLGSVKGAALQEGVTCETALRESDKPFQRIVDEAIEKKADMIIIGRHGRTGLLKLLMGKVAASVIGHAPCSVLIVPKAARMDYGKIMIATDGSEYSDAATSEAIEMAKRTGSQMIAVSVAHLETDLGEAKDNISKFMELAQKEGIQIAEVLTPVGKPYDSIVEIAGGRGVDLIVMGTYGKSGLKKLLMGSATEKVIGLASCAVLVVKKTRL